MVRALKARPADLLAADKAAMLALPPVAPPVGLRLRTRLPRDYYVRVFSNDYSVDPVAIGSIVADLDYVSIHRGTRLVGHHQRSWGHALTITDPAHVAAAARMREAFGQPQSARRQDTDVALADLSDYDTVFGVDLNISAQEAS